jgi:hypothetical protein
LKYTRTNKELQKFSEFAIQRAQLELGTTRTIRGRKVRRVAGGALQKSLYSTKVEKNGRLRILFKSKVDYADFIHDGVNGTKVNVGSRYSFTKQNINTDWMDDWMKSKRFRLKGPNGKFITKTPSALASAKFMIGRSIARNGIAPVPFMQMGVEAALKKFDNRIVDAIEYDLGKDLDDI